MNREITLDITQNAFMKLYMKYYSIKNKNSHVSYLFKTARNDVYNYSKNRKVVNSVTTPLDDNIPVKDDFDLREKIELEEIHELVMKMLNDLTEEQKETYLLREYGELKYSEIAAVTGVEEKTVKSRLFETRRKLVDELKKVI